MGTIFEMYNRRLLIRLILLNMDRFPNFYGLTKEQAAASRAHFEDELHDLTSDPLPTKGYEEAVRDIVASHMAHTTPEEIVDFDRELREKLGISFFSILNDTAKRVEKIKKRGKISNDLEYRIIEEVVEDNWESGRLDDILIMMRDYEKEHGL